MLTELAHLALRLEGPLQAWGYGSQFSRRNTGMFPTKSGILGMCCAAMKIPRGSEREKNMLGRMRELRLLTVAVPRNNYRNQENEPTLSVRRLTDYHTVQDTLKADRGKNKNTHLTWRQYLCDASFVAVLSGNRSLIEKVGTALRNPTWGIWLGRKACIPTAPVWAGVHHSRDDALKTVLGENPLSLFTYQQEVELFEDGTDTFADQPICFGGAQAIRSFIPRRIKLVEGKR
jgi:CRISPR system Cascade subunit CasD